jgi:uncharacterized membrane protein YqjE
LSLDAFSAVRPQLIVFFYLQILDFLTTVVGIKYGFAESSPFIRWLMHSGMTMGLAESKLVAVALAIICVLVDRGHLVRWINRWYALLVIWNLALMWAAQPK